MTFRTASLRRRLVLAISLPLFVIFVVSTLFDYRLARQTADAGFDQSLTDAVLDIAAHLEAESRGETPHISAEAEAMLRSDSDDQVYFSVRDGGGRLLQGDDLPRFRPALHAEQPLLFDGEMGNTPIRAAVKRIRQMQAPQGELIITVAETLHKRVDASHRIVTAMVLPNLLGILATLLAVYFGVRGGLAPLAQLEREIASRSPRDLREIAVGTPPREIRAMVARLNELFHLLRDASAAQQRFLADAAHQLRTPLAGLQTQIDLATAEGAFAGNRERLGPMGEATRRLVHLVNQLLAYARAEPTATLPQALAPMDLRTLVEEAASLFLDQAIHKGIDLGFDPHPAPLWGLPWVLREALANLVDNALRYTPEGGIVTVGCGQEGGAAWLSVEDNGRGIPEAEREKVFERFYRLPGSGQDGCGLGLAIVREIAALHGASIGLEEPEGGGLRVILRFPPGPALPLPSPPSTPPTSAA